MKDPRIRLGSRGLATVLAFLVPGAGHFYQGRHIKGGIFAVCILSTFFAGLVLGEGQPVYSQVIQTADGSSAQLDSARPIPERSLGYYAQVFVGAPALPALIQQWRYGSNTNTATPPLEALDVPFEGKIVGLEQGTGSPWLSGQLHLEPGRGQRYVGTISGNTAQGEQLSFNLDGRAILGKPIFGSPRREIRCDLAEDHAGGRAKLLGTIDRPFLDWFQAPRDNEELDRMHHRLSQRFDIACVFTWIAGLLNIMAVWDAFDGPAYGYGDEDAEPQDSKKDNE